LTVTLTLTAAVPAGGKFIGKVGWNGATTIAGISCPELSATGGTLSAAGTNGTNHIQGVYLDAPYGIANGTVITVTFSANSDSRHFSGNYVTGAGPGPGGSGQNSSGTTNAWSTTAILSTSDGLIYDAAYLAIDSSNTATSPNVELLEQKIATDSGSVDQYAAGTGSNITPAGTWGSGSAGWCATACLISAGTISAVGPLPRTANESSTATAGTSHVVNLPTGITAGDLLIVCMNLGSTAATVNALTGWTELLDEGIASGLYIAYRKADGTEGATITLTTSATTRDATITFRIANAQDPAVQAPQIGTTASGTSISPDPPNVTPTGGAKDYLAIALFGDAGEEADDDTWANTPPSGYLPSPPFQKACGTTGINLGGLIAAAYRSFNASAEDPGTFNQDVSLAWRAQTIIVHPAPAAVPKSLVTPGQRNMHRIPHLLVR
jgi:hypothetical protein